MLRIVNPFYFCLDVQIHCTQNNFDCLIEAMNNIDYTDENITGDNDIMFRSLCSEGQSQVWYYVALHHADNRSDHCPLVLSLTWS